MNGVVAGWQPRRGYATSFSKVRAELLLNTSCIPVSSLSVRYRLLQNARKQSRFWQLGGTGSHHTATLPSHGAPEEPHDHVRVWGHALA